MNIVFLDSSTLGDVSFEPVEAFGRLVLYDNSTPEEAVERVRDCEVLIVNRLLMKSMFFGMVMAFQYPVRQVAVS